jgi:hypothetical protein
LLQSSVKEPAREGLHHDGDKEGQQQISRDRKAEAQSSMRNYGRVLINVEISALGHCVPPDLVMAITLMTAPSVITPRRANELTKAKQLSGTATASNKSRFMAKCVCGWLRRPT